MAKSNNKLVHCRYPKCKFLHETTELNKDDAVCGDGKNSYYHPDCYHTMRTVNYIRDTFVKQVNPMLTGPQIGQLVSIVNNMIFSKGIDANYILFALQFFIKNKPGALKYPGGIAYIVQNRDVEEAWKKAQRIKLQAEIREKQKEEMESVNDVGHPTIELPNNATYKSQNKSRFSSVLGV